MIILFNLIGLCLIAFVIWWFWLSKPKQTVDATQAIIEIIVADGLYTPALIQAKQGATIKLCFLRKDEQPCAETVVFADFDTSAELPVGKPVELALQCDRAGKFEFTCQMGMYRGVLVVE